MNRNLLGLVLVLILIGVGMYFVTLKPVEAPSDAGVEAPEAAPPSGSSDEPGEPADVGPTGEVAEEEAAENVQVANPASVYCGEQGGVLELREGGSAGFVSLRTEASVKSGHISEGSVLRGNKVEKT